MSRLLNVWAYVLEQAAIALEDAADHLQRIGL